MSFCRDNPTVQRDQLDIGQVRITTLSTNTTPPTQIVSLCWGLVLLPQNYLQGCQFTVTTNHDALKWILNLAASTCKQLFGNYDFPKLNSLSTTVLEFNTKQLTHYCDWRWLKPIKSLSMMIFQYCASPLPLPGKKTCVWAISTIKTWITPWKLSYCRQCIQSQPRRNPKLKNNISLRRSLYGSMQKTRVVDKHHLLYAHQNSRIIKTGLDF